MNIKTKVFNTFLKKVKMDGTQIVDEAIFDFNDGGLKISAMTGGNTTRIDAMLMSSAFGQYEAIGKVGVQGIAQITKILDTFKDEVDISIEGNVLRLKEGGRKVEVELIDLQFLTEVGALKELQFDETIKIKSVDLNKFISDVNINKDFELIFDTKPKQLILSNTGKYKFTQILPVEEAQGGVTAKFGAPFIDVVKALTDNILLSMKTDFPIKILEKTDVSTIVIITAPRIENKG